MITELLLVSNNGESTAAFWSAIFNVPAEDLGDGRWRVEPVAGPAVTVSTARVAETISRYADLTVVTDHGAADRLRQLGYEVALDGSQAVDVNGTDSTVHLVARGWDGVSDVPWEEPPASVTGHVVWVETDDPAAVSRFLAAWFGVEPDRQVPGVARFLIRDVLIRVTHTEEVERRWIPLGSQDYPAAVERCAAAGFEVIPSAGGPVGGHVELGGHTWLLVQLHRDDAYYERFSRAVEAGDYRVVGPVEIRGEEPEA